MGGTERGRGREGERERGREGEREGGTESHDGRKQIDKYKERKKLSNYK